MHRIGINVGIFRDKKINTMSIIALAHCFPRLLALIKQDYQALVFHKEVFERCAPALRNGGECKFIP